MPLHEATLSRIQLLHPVLREEAESIYRDTYTLLQGRVKPIYTQTLRTFAEQQALYDQGRTKLGEKVTNAKPGSSYHNYGLAVDFSLLLDGRDLSWDVKKDWDHDRQSDWMEVVAVFKAEGWKWGGDWVTFKDMPHFEKTFGYNWKDLLKKHNTGDFITGTKYVRL